MLVLEFVGHHARAGGADMKKILRSRLPERLADRVPPLLVELGVGVLLAAVAAGWRSGLVALIVGQTFAWFAVVGRVGPAVVNVHPLAGLAASSVSQLVILTIISLYQWEVGKGTAEREKRLELLDQARREIDHRAKNNFQTVLSLVQLQAARESEPKVKTALQQVADRILAISVATEHLAIRSEDLATVPLRDHLCGLCEQLERGLARGDVRVECDVANVTASADTAIHLAIIVNELVTNSLKHAFDDGRSGLVRVHSKLIGDGLELEVADDGGGMKSAARSSGTGLGRKLVETFAKHLDAKLEVSSSPAGTSCKILVPALV
jgi:two-component sensor histidine kinase